LVKQKVNTNLDEAQIRPIHKALLICCHLRRYIQGDIFVSDSNVNMRCFTQAKAYGNKQ